MITPISNRTGLSLIRVMRAAILVVLVGTLFASAVVAIAYFTVPRVTAFQDVESSTLYAAVKDVGFASIGEAPHIDAQNPVGPIPICPGASIGTIKPLKLAFGLMRGTAEGRRLFELLIDNNICVQVDDIPYNAAFAVSRRTFPDDWSESRIVVDRSIVRSSSIDLLAAILVHESTHIDRSVSGKACFFQDNCELLDNGVEFGEELAAHAAEAEWWIAAFGVDGKRFAFRGDYGENKLAEAYLLGEDAFRLYVFDYRNDPREGSGI